METSGKMTGKFQRRFAESSGDDKNDDPIRHRIGENRHPEDLLRKELRTSESPTLKIHLSSSP